MTKEEKLEKALENYKKAIARNRERCLQCGSDEVASKCTAAITALEDVLHMLKSESYLNYVYDLFGGESDD